jgi:hypothetical protein
MHFPKADQFLDEIISYVRFVNDRDAIRKELGDHILDRMNDYIEQGFDKENAEILTIHDMGDAKEIGQALNKEHNPVLGRIWIITNALLVLIVIGSIYLYGFTILLSFDSLNIGKVIPKSDVVYRVDIKKTVKVDDMVVKFTGVIYEKNGQMNILYEYYDTRLWGGGWSFTPFETVSDNLGNTYFNGGSMSKSGFICRGIQTYDNFSSDADTLIIKYDKYNRSFTVEIPLKEGNTHE